MSLGFLCLLMCLDIVILKVTVRLYLVRFALKIITVCLVWRMRDAITS